MEKTIIKKEDFKLVDTILRNAKKYWNSQEERTDKQRNRMAERKVLKEFELNAKYKELGTIIDSIARYLAYNNKPVNLRAIKKVLATLDIEFEK